MNGLFSVSKVPFFPNSKLSRHGQSALQTLLDSAAGDGPKNSPIRFKA